MMVNDKDKDFIHLRMVVTMVANLKTMNLLREKLWLKMIMVIATLVIKRTVNGMVMVSWNIAIRTAMKVSFWTIKDMEMVYLLKLMANNMMGSGNTITKMVMEYKLI